MKSAFLFLLLFISSIAVAQKDSLQTTYTPLNIYKFNFFSPLFGHSMFSVERGIKIDRSIEYSLSFIGAGNNLNKPKVLGVKGYPQFGLSIGVGPRFYLPNQKKQHSFSRSSLTGIYIKPALYSGYYYDSQNLRSINLLESNGYLSIAALLEGGLQAILNKKMAFDLYLGVGYGFVKSNSLNENKSNYSSTPFRATNSVYQYSHARLGNNFGLSFSCGFRIGLVLKQKMIKN
jgi:hypothetical protein